jgi:DNA-binding CsgD family transcriptional regulator
MSNGNPKMPNLADVRDIPIPNERWLQHLFDLTPAEARLAQGLISGDTLEQVARALEIKMPTARIQLARIFKKTGTQRHAALVAVLARIAHLGA